MTILEKKLKSKQVAAILEAIKEYRISGTAKSLPVLIEVLNESNNIAIIEAITSLLDDIKDKTAIPVIIDHIENPKFKKARSILLASCWKSGLNYGSYGKVFMLSFIQDDFATALEAYTTLDSNIHLIPRSDLQVLQDMLEEAIGSLSENKKALALDLIDLIENYLA